MTLKRFVVAEFERKAQAVMTVDILGERIVEGDKIEYGDVVEVEILTKEQARKGGYAMAINGEPLVTQSRLSRNNPQKATTFNMASRKLTTDPEATGRNVVRSIGFSWNGKV